MSVLPRKAPRAAHPKENVYTKDKSESVLFRAIKQCPAAVVITDAEGNIEFVNPKFEETTGYSAREVAGQNPRILKSNETPSSVYKDLWSTITAGGVWNGELQNRRKDGTLFWERAVISGMLDEQGRVTHYVAVKEDITDRKHLEGELNLERILLRSLLDSLPDSIYFKDLASRYIRIGRTMAENIHLSDPIEGMGKTDQDFFEPDSALRAYQDEQEIIRTGEPILDRIEVGGSPDAPHVVVQTTKLPLRDLSSRIIGTFGVTRDVTADFEARNALERSEEKFKAISETSHFAMVIIEQDGIVSFWNRAATRLFGYTAEEVLGKPLPQLLPAGPGVPNVIADFSDYRRTGVKKYDNQILEFDGRRKDGSTVPIAFSLASVEVGNKVFGVGIVRDLTKARQLEYAIRESESRLKEALEGARFGTWDWDLHTGRTDWGGHHVAIFGDDGNDPAEIGAGLERQIHPDDIPAFRDKLANSRNEKLPFVHDYRIHATDGSERWLSARGSFFHNNEGVPIRMRGVISDITNRKIIEERLTRSEEFTRGILETIPSHLCVLNDEGVIVMTNRSWQGFAVANNTNLASVCEGNNYLTVCEQATGEDASVAKDVANAIREVIAGRQRSFETEYPCHSLDQKRWFVARVGRFAGSGPVRVVVTHEDVTERHRAEEERTAMQLQINQAQKLESIGRLAAGIAHEINTPTQYINDNMVFMQSAMGDMARMLSMYQEALQKIEKDEGNEALLKDIETKAREADLDYLVEEVPKAIEQSLEGISRVTKIVRAMKEFSHPGVDEKTPININSAIESTVTVARNEWKYVAELRLELEPSLSPVTCMPGEFNQVILNLVINAAHAIEEKARGVSEFQGEICITTRRIGEMVEVCIKDNGIGISKALSHKIFTPFFTTKPIGKGTGQGLSLARTIIVEKHGGTIDIDSEEGIGTTCRICLPIFVEKGGPQE